MASDGASLDNGPPRYWSHADTSPVPLVRWMKFKGRDVAVDELIGNGGFGKVYAVCESRTSSCTLRGEFAWAMKLQLLENPFVVNDHFLEEVSWAERVAGWNIGVKLSEWDITTVGSLPESMQEFKGETPSSTVLVGITITDRWTSDLRRIRQDWAFAAKAQILQRLEQVITTLHGHSIVHADLLPKNVLVRFSPHGEFEDLTLTDFGFTFPIVRTRGEVQSWTPCRLAYYFDGEGNYINRLPKVYQPLVNVAHHIKNHNPSANYRLISDWIIKDPKELDRLILYHFANWR